MSGRDRRHDLATASPDGDTSSNRHLKAQDALTFAA